MRRLDTPPYSFAVPDETYLRALYEQAVQQPDVVPVAFHEAVCVFTRRARNEGVPIERIIVALKEMLGATLHDAGSGGGMGMSPAHRMVDGAVRACIEQYYAS
jgi:hypothetical protein